MRWFILHLPCAAPCPVLGGSTASLHPRDCTPPARLPGYSGRWCQKLCKADATQVGPDESREARASLLSPSPGFTFTMTGRIKHHGAGKGSPQ